MEVPIRQGAFSGEMEKEIIEEYDEERERLWRIQHKENLRKYKLIEKEKRERDIKKNAESEEKDVNIFELLEKAELMEELHSELENMEVNEVTDEVLAQLMKAEQEGTANKKQYHSHCKTNTNSSTDKTSEKLCDSEKKNEPFGANEIGKYIQDNFSSIYIK